MLWFIIIQFILTVDIISLAWSTPIGVLGIPKHPDLSEHGGSKNDSTTLQGAAIPTPYSISNGTVANCKYWHYVSAGENCFTIQKMYPQVTVEEIMKWNPYV